jgi:hypothetical protein
MVGRIRRPSAYTVLRRSAIARPVPYELPTRPIKGSSNRTQPDEIIA